MTHCLIGKVENMNLIRPLPFILARFLDAFHHFPLKSRFHHEHFFWFAEIFFCYRFISFICVVHLFNQNGNGFFLLRFSVCVCLFFIRILGRNVLLFCRNWIGVIESDCNRRFYIEALAIRSPMENKQTGQANEKKWTDNKRIMFSIPYENKMDKQIERTQTNLHFFPLALCISF